MKCPVCDKEITSMLCPNCGFDSSKDYGKYPTFGTLWISSASALRKEWQKQQMQGAEKPVQNDAAWQQEPAVPVSQASPDSPAGPGKKRKLLPLLIAAAFVLTLGLGIWIGTGLRSEPGVALSQASEWRGNVLKADPFIGSDYVYRKNYVKSVTFLDSQAYVPEGAIDVSADGSGSVMLWSVQTGATYDLFFAADGGINGREACCSMFAGCVNLEKINFGGAFHTGEVQDMSSMFSNCMSLVSLDLSGFDTSGVQDMSRMFSNCRRLTDLKRSDGFVPRNTDTYLMFNNCPAGDD